MNKRILILVGIVICMLLNVMKPTVVNALGPDTFTENQSGEVDVDKSEGETPINVDSETPTKVDGETPANVDSETPTKVDGETPANADSETPTKVDGETPANVDSEIPTKVDGENPANADSETPIKVDGETDSEGELSTSALAKATPPIDDVEDDNGSSDAVEDDIHGGEIYDIQKVKVIITKVDEDGNMLAGAKLQIKDQKGNVLDEWTSTTEAHEIQLPDGTYILHEVEAPEGYELAEDQEIIVKVELANLDAGVDFSTTPCPHYGGTPLYYVEIETVSHEIIQHEVYCINQDWETPDDNSQYDGALLNSTDIRNYTQQTVKIDAHENLAKIDVSDQSLTSQQLYDKILDVIYYRHKAVSEFTDLTEAEIRYVTELALKNYTNAGLTRVQGIAKSKAPEGYDRFNYYEDSSGKIWYLYPWYRSFVYLPDAAANKDIFKEVPGGGDAFGTLARHWNGGDHNAKGNSTVRAKVARYYELYQYLIHDEGNDKEADHPKDMHLYIYSTLNKATDLSGNNFDEGAYQNLLGVTGYFEDIKQQEQKETMVNKYSTETVEVTIQKVWDDADNQDGKRPTSLKVKLSNGTIVTLNEENGWKATIKDLPKYNKTKLVTYTWEEVSLPEGYKLTKKETEGYVTTLTNSYTPEVRSVKVTKVWADDDDEEKKRPENVTITLLANGKEYDTIVLSEENEWKYEFTNLPVYNAGEKITYTVREENIPEGYVASYEEDGETGFIIHNVKGEGDHEPPPDNPQTGSNIVLYLLTLLVSIIGFVSGKVYLKEEIKD